MKLHQRISCEPNLPWIWADFDNVCFYILLHTYVIHICLWTWIYFVVLMLEVDSVFSYLDFWNSYLLIFAFIFLSWPGSILWFFCRRSISKVESTISGGGSCPILLRLCSIIPEIPYNINFQSVTFCIHHSLSRSTLYFLNYRPNTSQYKLSIKVFLHPLGSSTIALCLLHLIARY